MNALLRRIGSAVSPLALLIALLALVASAAGAGYAAGQIGTNQIKNSAITSQKIKKNAVTTKKIKKNAVTGDKVKDGTLSTADLPAEERFRAATLSNGGEGDCVWQSGDALIPGVGAPTFRKDRDGIVHLAGIAAAVDGAGGDGACDGSGPGQQNDLIAYTLPAGYVPFKTLIIASLSGTGGGVIITGPNGLVISGISLPAGAVIGLTSGGGSPQILQDNISFEAAGSPSVARTAASGKLSPAGRALLHSMGL